MINTHCNKYLTPVCLFSGMWTWDGNVWSWSHSQVHSWKLGLRWRQRLWW